MPTAGSRPSAERDRRFLRRYGWLSLGVALFAIALKLWAYVVSGSIGLLSDALESVVNVAGAAMALWMLTVAARGPDDEHEYGHSKAEYFSSGVEGALIVLAAIAIIAEAVDRLWHPHPLDRLGVGLALTFGATVLNGLTARTLGGAGRRFHSAALEANARHLLTDVWTSVGVIVAVGAVGITGWHPLDPIIALLVAANIIRVGVEVMEDAVHGLMDTALPAEARQAIQEALEPFLAEGVQYHALRTRRAGARGFISLHVLVPGGWSVHQGHQLLERVEASIRRAVPNVTVFTHLESLEDPASWDDQSLDRDAARHRGR